MELKLSNHIYNRRKTNKSILERKEIRSLKKILSITLILMAASLIPSSFPWDGLMAMDADKRNVERGQIITYEGYLYGERPIDGEIISISVSEKETNKIILTSNTNHEYISVEYFENIAWYFTFQVETYKEFADGKTYVVEAKYDDKSTKLDFFIQHRPEPTCLEILSGEGVMVFTDREKYDRGDIIIVSGCLSEKAFTKGINITVYDPKGNKIGVSTMVPNSDRTFSGEFIIDEKFGLDGTYSVEVDAGGLYSSTKSFAVPEFGAIAIVVMLVAVTAVVLMSSKYTKIIPKL